MKLFIGLLLGAVISLPRTKGLSQVADTAELIRDASCFPSQGFMRVCFRALLPDGQANPQLKENLLRATKIDCTFYVLPCYSCGDPKGQIDRLCRAIEGTGFVYHPYVAVEDPKRWTGNQSKHRKFVAQVVEEIERRRECFASAKFRTTKQDWEMILGPDCTTYQYSSLWYISNDGKKDFGDFQPFGGWHYPFLKQYARNKTLCGSTVNFNVRAFGRVSGFEKDKLELKTKTLE